MELRNKTGFVILSVCLFVYKRSDYLINYLIKMKGNDYEQDKTHH